MKKIYEILINFLSDSKNLPTIITLFLSFIFFVSNRLRMLKLFKIKEYSELIINPETPDHNLLFYIYLKNKTNIAAIDIYNEIIIEINNKKFYFTKDSYNIGPLQVKYILIDSELKNFLKERFPEELSFAEIDVFRDNDNIKFKKLINIDIKIFIKAKWKPPLYKEKYLSVSSGYKLSITEMDLQDQYLLKWPIVYPCKLIIPFIIKKLFSKKWILN